MKKKNQSEIFKLIKFDSNGLIPAIIQDYKTDKVLMLAYMNEEALKLTLSTKRTHFFSRSRQKIWMKGEESGHIQEVKDIYIDCDNDTILIKVRQVGSASCHSGYESCFYRKLDKNFNIKVVGKKIFDPEKVYKK
ncbi:MAG: phosphoribosyl-AMP cyclohydrolase [Elusimicrobiota bacterium]|nr:phosphoribosyl-AMP cyclohydrolase [Endomicrobiia bacterium]MDW8166212.1 phosphoribosyl-AMP cyclohydrolase [Elusimicrobiota bacterium]